MGFRQSLKGSLDVQVPSTVAARGIVTPALSSERARVATATGLVEDRMQMVSGRLYGWSDVTG
jgi:hypothetical protein